jgi:hypothetical protein
VNDATTTHFLNVDLEVLADHELTALVQAFEPGASALNCMAVPHSLSRPKSERESSSSST